MDRLRQALAAGPVLLLDGGIGSELLRRGLPSDRPLESANLHDPETVLAVHRAYRKAGAMALTTNTFLARRTAYPNRHPEGFDWRGCNREGVRLARQAAGRDGFVFASVGPPLPEVHLSEAVDDAVEQVSSFLAGDETGRPDALLLETQSDPEFVVRLMERIARVFGGSCCPVIVSFAYRGDLGVPRLHPSGMLPEEAARIVERHRSGVLALGVNCGREVNLNAMLEVLGRYRTATDLPLLARPNAGTPKATAQGPCWPITPAEFADWTEHLVRAGARLVGGCCGTTPEHIAAARQRLEQRGMSDLP